MTLQDWLAQDFTWRLWQAARLIAERLDELEEAEGSRKRVRFLLRRAVAYLEWVIEDWKIFGLETPPWAMQWLEEGRREAIRL